MDVCSGTGDMVIDLKKVAPGGTKLIATDFSEPMIRVAKSKSSADGISFVLATASSLPFPNETFDLITLSFATRNLNIIEGNLSVCLGEFYRVLKKGGRFVNLETSQPRSKIIKMLGHLYVRSFIGPLGRLLSGSKNGYEYLSSSMASFYSPDELSEIITRSGFSQVSYIRKCFGMVAVHKGFKGF